MPHSLRAKLSGLRYKGILEDKDYKRLCEALDNEDVLEQIRAEIDVARFIDKDTKLCKNANASGLEVALQIIDKYR
jgi:hypothetical protein